MGVYLYCVLPADAPEPGVQGIDDAPIRVVRHAGVAVWTSDVDATPRPELERIRAHDRVARAALEAGVTPVPIRFGQVLASDDALRAHLDAHDYRPALERVAGAVEFGIRIVDPDAKAVGDEGAGEEGRPAAFGAAGATSSGAPGTTSSGAAGATSSGTGAAYLRAVARRIRAVEQARERALATARALDGALAEWVRDSRIEASERPPGAVLAHLVQAGAVESYATRARELSREHPPLRVVVTGPWPPYSFVAP